MQINLLLASVFNVILLTGGCYSKTDTLYYSELSHTELSSFDVAINSEDDLKGPICSISVDTGTTKILVEIAMAGRETEPFHDDSIMFVIADGQEKLFILNGWKQIQLKDGAISEISDDDQYRIFENLQESTPIGKCGQN